jgi:Spy/CpxP family protein refolding chaperone
MDMSKRIAPPIAAVRLHYIDKHPDQAAFVQAVSGWMEKQDVNKSLMKGAIKKFNIMPPMTLPKKDVEKIAAYMYSGNIEKPAGFEEHVKEQHGKKGMGNMEMHSNDKHQKMHGKSSGKENCSLAKKGKLMQQLGLSPQQKQQMKVLMQEKKQRVQPLKQHMRQIKQSMFQLDSTHPNYKAQIFALANEKAKYVYRMTLHKGEMRQKIEAILSPEQRVKFKQFRQHHGMKRYSH